MSHLLRNASRRVGLGTVMLVLASTVFGQSPSEPTEVKPILKIGATSSLGDAALFMMVRTRPDLTEKEILGTLKRGLEKSGCTIDGEPILRPIRPTIYEEFESLINQTAGSVVAAADGPLVPRLIPAREVLWEFRLKEPSQLLKSLKVTYKTAGVKVYEPKDPRLDPQAALTLTALGRYALRPEANDEAIHYEATVSTLGKPDEVQADKWPEMDRYFVIIMRNFKGNRNLLFATVQDGNQVPNPLTQVRLAPDLMFVFANLGVDTPRAGTAIDGNDLVTQVLGVRGRKVRRVWMLFPLSEENLAQVREQYSKFDSDQLAREIRKNRFAADAKVEVGPTSTPGWIELGDLGNGEVFGRRIPLKDLDKLRQKYARVHRLLVWEFDDGRTAPGAIAVQHPNGGRVWFIDEEVREWPTELARSLKSKSDK